MLKTKITTRTCELGWRSRLPSHLPPPRGGWPPNWHHGAESALLSAFVPNLFRTCFALAPHLCRTCAALVPHLCRTCAALVPQCALIGGAVSSGAHGWGASLAASQCSCGCLRPPWSNACVMRARALLSRRHSSAHTPSRRQRSHGRSARAHQPVAPTGRRRPANRRPTTGRSAASHTRHTRPIAWSAPRSAPSSRPKVRRLSIARHARRVDRHVARGSHHRPQWFVGGRQ